MSGAEGGTRIRELPESERPRERLLQHGASALKTAELIAILLRTGREGASALDVAQEIVTRYGDLDGLARADVVSLSKIKGVGPAKALQLVAAFGLGARLSRSVAEARVVQVAADVVALLGEEMRLLNHESVRVILLNTKYHLLGVEEVSRGVFDESVFHPREALRAALARNAAAVILVHNHPSGDPRPSPSDRQVTERFAQAAQLMQVPLLDHVILGVASKENESGYFSFKEHLLL